MKVGKGIHLNAKAELENTMYVICQYDVNQKFVLYYIKGILEYEQLLHEIHTQELIFDVVVLRVDSIDQCYRRLTKIYNDDHGNIRVLLNMEPEDSQAVISRLVSYYMIVKESYTLYDFNIYSVGRQR